MKLISFFAFLLLNGYPKSMNIFDFNTTTEIREWSVVNDGVMGGLSQGNMSLSADGHGVFGGTVSLENNGGFSSVRYRPDQLDINGADHCKIRLKGDGKNYQFRVKKDIYDRYSYIYTFETTGDWQVVTIPLNEMYPSFRGRRLDLENYAASTIAEVTFLIGNKKAESFRLELDWIRVEKD